MSAVIEQAPVAAPPETDLQRILSRAVETFIASGKAEVVIEEAIGKTVVKVLNDALGSTHSDFGKQIEKSVLKSLNVGPGFQLPDYNDLVCKVVRQQVDGVLNESMARQVKERLDDILGCPLTSITLEELVKAVKEDRGYDDASEITLMVDGGSKFARWVAIDPCKGKKKYDCKYRFLVGSDGVLCALHLNGRETEKTIFAGPISSTERLLFGLMANKATLIIPDDWEVSIDLSRDEDDDE